MFRAAGIDLGHTETRTVSIGLFWGVPRKESGIPSGMRCTAAMPSDQLTFRTLNVPDAGRSDQGNVIREELRLSLPFSLSDAVWDWVSKEDAATAAVAINGQLEEIQEKAGKDTVIDAEPFSYLRLCQAAEEPNALIFDFGASRTTICAIKEGMLDWVKVSFRGGVSLSQEIASAHNMSFEDAEEHKKALGMEEPLCGKWLAAILESAMLTGSSEGHEFGKIFVCGGGARMKGLFNALGSIFGQPAETFPLPEGLDVYTDAAAYGTALAAKSKMPSVCLHKEEEEEPGLPWKYAVWMAVLLILATGSINLHERTALELEAEQEAVYRKAVETRLPELAKQPPENYQSELNKRTAVNISNRLHSPDYLLDIMARLAKPVSRQPQIEVRRFILDGESSVPKLLVGGQAGSVRQVDEFRQGMEGTLDKPEILDNRKGREGSVNFSIEGEVPVP